MTEVREYATETRERAVRLVFEYEGEHALQWAVISSITGKIGCTPETLRSWVRRAERDSGKRPGLTTDEQRLKGTWSERSEWRNSATQEIYMINLAVEELITNAVSYGLEGVVQPRIEIAENAGTAYDPLRLESVGANLGASHYGFRISIPKG